MKTLEFYTTVNKITSKDDRYPAEAYEFINDAVIYTVKVHEEHKNKTDSRHISGKELLAGVEDFALKTFGPLAFNVFEEWGINDGIAIGNIVFNMVEHQLLTTSDKDSIDDFRETIEFEVKLSKPFLPKDPDILLSAPIIA
ncbi:MAG TPA: Minf_1886 family protein [Victivallales bacterium]|nr:Minf_1886 family protein [Victivallales bacterium]